MGERSGFSRVPATASACDLAARPLAWRSLHAQIEIEPCILLDQGCALALTPSYRDVRVSKIAGPDMDIK